jgi:hypothetical protein
MESFLPTPWFLVPHNASFPDSPPGNGGTGNPEGCSIRDPSRWADWKKGEKGIIP